jgi:hypothetical protein
MLEMKASFGFYALLLIGAVGISLEGEYSSFSGIIANFRVGSSDVASIENLRLGLRFSSSESALYSRWECPPFVSHCFVPEMSNSFSDAMIEKSKEDSLGSRKGYLVKDILRSGEGSLIKDNFSFQFVTVNQPTSLLFRDVSGYIGMGKYSDTFENKVVKIAELEDNKISITITENDISTEVLESSSDDSENWSFMAQRFSLGTQLMKEDIDRSFDPIAQDIILPVGLRRNLITRARLQGIKLEVNSDGRVGFECRLNSRISGQFFFEIGVSRTVSIRLDSESLEFPPEAMQPEPFNDPRRGDYAVLCPLRIRLSDDSLDNKIIIGRQLIRAVGSIQLNYRTGSMGIVSRGSDQGRGSFPIVESVVPTFSDPVVDISSSRISFLSTGSDDGLYLLSLNHRTIDSANQPLHCWDLQRIRNKATGRSNSVVRIPAVYKDVDVILSPYENGEIVFQFIKSDDESTADMKVSLVYRSSNEVRVCVSGEVTPETSFHRSSTRSSQERHSQFPISFRVNEPSHTIEHRQVRTGCWPLFSYLFGRTPKIAANG